MEILRRPATHCTRKRQCTSKECRDCKDGLGDNECFVPSVKTRGVLPKPKKEPRPPMTPESFYKLPQMSKIHQLVLVYMATCVPGGFSKKSLFPLTRYFAGKVDPVNYQVFYDYLYSIKEPVEVNLYDLYSKSAAWQLNLRMQSNTPMEAVKPYESLLDCLKGL